MPRFPSAPRPTTHLVLIQALVLVVVLAWPGSWWWRAAALLLLVLVAAAVLVRRQGRELYAWVATGLAFRRRRRRGERDATLRYLVDPLGGLVVEAHVDRAGTRYGLLRDAVSWTSLLALEPPDAEEADAPGHEAVSLGLLFGVLAQGKVRPASVHAVLRVLPTLSPRVDPRSPVATSYREVADDLVAQRTLLVGLRVEPARSTWAVTVRGGGELGARRMLAAATARFVASLGDAARVRVLGPDEVRAAVGAGLGVSPGPVAESWTDVDSGRDGVQVCYGIDGWGADPTTLLAELCGLPGILVVVSLVAERGRPPTAVLRVLCLPEDADIVDAALHRTARAHGARIHRLDGRHAVATARTLPGGGPEQRVRLPDGLLRLPSPSWVDLALPLDRGGLALGRHGDGRPVPLELFRDRPTAVSALLDPRVVLVIGFRALAVGAQVSLVTTRAERWLPLRELGVADTDVVGIFSPETMSLPTSVARPDRPHLVILDLPDRVDLPRIPGQPWQSVITVLPELSMRTLPAARAAGPVLMRRLSRREVIAAVPFLGLPAGSDRRLTELDDEQLAVAVLGRLSVVDLGLTVAESQLVIAATGAPPRSAAEASRPRVQAEDDAQQRQQRGEREELDDIEEPARVR